MGVEQHRESQSRQARTDSAETSSDRADAIRRGFEETYQAFLVGEMPRASEDGSEALVRAYEFIIDHCDQQERRAVIVNFGLSAAASGYTQAFGPVSLPDVGFRDPRGEHPLSAVYFFIEAPSAPSRTETPIR